MPRADPDVHIQLDGQRGIRVINVHSEVGGPTRRCRRAPSFTYKDRGIYTLELFLDFLWGKRPEVLTPLFMFALVLLHCILDLLDVVFDLSTCKFGFPCHLPYSFAFSAAAIGSGMGAPYDPD